MRHDDAKILREVQRSTQIGMEAIETLLDKTEDDDFSRQLSRQSLRYSQIHDKALDRILQGDGEAQRPNQVTRMLLRGGIHLGTALNISRGRMAEIMIQSGSRGITSMWRAMQHNRLAADETVELAQELVDFEQESIRQLRKYL